MPFQPATEEPSNAWPDVNLSSSKWKRHCHVLFLATGVRKTEVNEIDFVLLHHLHHVCNGLAIRFPG